MSSRDNSIEALRHRIPESDFDIEFSRSPGPGGQNVNKVNTRVLLRLNIENCAGLSDAEKSRVRKLLRTRITKEDNLQITAFRHRTQNLNRKEAIDRCFELLAEALHRPKRRIATQVPRGAKRRRREDKKHRGQVKSLRSRVDE
ncbi:MAG: alternative ribosome rescue aminoacyl-tRNA hydrolase ArfB [Phycisphaerae bacterium]